MWKEFQLPRTHYTLSEGYITKVMYSYIKSKSPRWYTISPLISAHELRIVGGQWRHKITIYGNVLSVYTHIWQIRDVTNRQLFTRQYYSPALLEAVWCVTPVRMSWGRLGDREPWPTQRLLLLGECCSPEIIGYVNI